jgi:hypothetical protein
MVKAIQAGHEIKGMSKEMRGKLHKAADSMTHKQVDDFSYMAKAKPKKKKS